MVFSEFQSQPQVTSCNTEIIQVFICKKQCELKKRSPKWRPKRNWKKNESFYILHYSEFEIYQIKTNTYFEQYSCIILSSLMYQSGLSTCYIVLYGICRIYISYHVYQNNLETKSIIVVFSKNVIQQGSVLVYNKTTKFVQLLDLYVQIKQILHNIFFFLNMFSCLTSHVLFHGTT